MQNKISVSKLHTVNVLKFQTLNSILFLAKILLFIQLFLKIHGGMANSVDPDQTAPFRGSLIWVCTVCTCHFVRNFDVRNFRTFIVPSSNFYLFRNFIQLNFNGSNIFVTMEICSRHGLFEPLS